MAQCIVCGKELSPEEIALTIQEGILCQKCYEEREELWSHWR
ncbi:MAG: DUF4428 domain-containing protein [bacterium]